MEQVDEDCLVATEDKHQYNFENSNHVLKLFALLLPPYNRCVDNLDEHELDDQMSHHDEDLSAHCILVLYVSRILRE